MATKELEKRVEHLEIEVELLKMIVGLLNQTLKRCTVQSGRKKKEEE